jgi:hypothetical protein
MCVREEFRGFQPARDFDGDWRYLQGGTRQSLAGQASQTAGAGGNPKNTGKIHHHATEVTRVGVQVVLTAWQQSLWCPSREFGDGRDKRHNVCCGSAVTSVQESNHTTKQQRNVKCKNNYLLYASV